MNFQISINHIPAHTCTCFDKVTFLQIHTDTARHYHAIFQMTYLQIEHLIFDIPTDRFTDVLTIRFRSQYLLPRLPDDRQLRVDGMSSYSRRRISSTAQNRPVPDLWKPRKNSDLYVQFGRRVSQKTREN